MDGLDKFIPASGLIVVVACHVDEMVQLIQWERVVHASVAVLISVLAIPQWGGAYSRLSVVVAVVKGRCDIIVSLFVLDSRLSVMLFVGCRVSCSLLGSVALARG